MRQVNRRLGKLWSQSSYLKGFNVLCHILGGVGKSYTGHVMYFCFLQRYKSKCDKIKEAILKRAVCILLCAVFCETVLCNACFLTYAILVNKKHFHHNSPFTCFKNLWCALVYQGDNSVSVCVCISNWSVNNF